MVLIAIYIVTGVYKPTNITFGGPTLYNTIYGHGYDPGDSFASRLAPARESAGGPLRSLGEGRAAG